MINSWNFFEWKQKFIGDRFFKVNPRSTKIWICHGFFVHLASQVVIHDKKVYEKVVEHKKKEFETF